MPLHAGDAKEEKERDQLMKEEEGASVVRMGVGHPEAKLLLDLTLLRSSKLMLPEELIGTPPY